MTSVSTEYADGIAVITINRPESRNAVNLDVAQRIAAAIDEFEARPDLTVAIWSVPAFMDTELGCQLTELPIS